jgi:large subunit ribosomal protein L29
MRKVRELREKTADDLKDEVRKLSEELMKMRMKNAVGQLDKPKAIHTTKKTLARAKTLLREKELKIR